MLSKDLMTSWYRGYCGAQGVVGLTVWLYLALDT
jgi:hypothetical protein